MKVDEKALGNLGWPELLEGLAARTHTARGAAAARALTFANDLLEARERGEEIAEARKLREAGEPMPWGGVSDLREALVRAEKGGMLEGADLRAVAETLRAAQVLRKFLVGRFELAPGLAARAEPMVDLPDVVGPIEDSFEPSGRLSDHASAPLGPLRRRAAELHSELSRTVRGLLDDEDVAPLLQDKFYTQRDDRYVLPIKAAARGRIKGIVHGSSQSGQTVFIEPENVVDLNNALRLAELEVADEERRILTELSSYVRGEIPRISKNLEILERLDWIDAGARLAEDFAAAPAELDEHGEVTLRAARHPLMVLGGRPCVPIDITIPPGGTLIVSGPNAGGKTVALKTLGLSALMAATGLQLPAEPSSGLPLYDEILCDIGDEQSLERNLSTFSGHLLRLREFLERAKRGVLVLIDEIAVGTDPGQGAVIAQAVLEELAQKEATVLVTTHYDRLKMLAAVSVDDAPVETRFVNASVGFDLNKMEPTYQLHIGIPGSSGAIVVARRLGLPPEVVVRAESLLGAEEASIENILVSLADERRRLEEERARLEEVRKQAERAQAAADANARELRDRTQKLHQQSYDEAVEALRAVRVELDRLRVGSRRTRNPQTEVSKAAETIARHAPQKEMPGVPVREEDILPGMKVIITTWGGEGTVVAPPARGHVLVQVGALRTMVAVEHLRKIEGRGPLNRPPSSSFLRAPSTSAKEDARFARPDRMSPSGPTSPSGSGSRTSENTLDLRGERVDDALRQLDKFIDEGLRREWDTVFVLHGHGTGALRAAIREHLAEHPAVTKFQPADSQQGGDGVTAIVLE